jgi:hypothetical protein
MKKLKRLRQDARESADKVAAVLARNPLAKQREIAAET